MKTAMQELIERLAEKQSMWDKKSKEHIDIANTYYVAIIMAKKLLEKEKKQIIAPVDRLCDFYGHPHIGEQMYNTWYVEPILKPINQNK